MAAPFAAENTPTHPDEGSPGQQAQRQPQPPDGQVFPTKSNGTPGPLQGGREIYIASALALQLCQIGNPFGIQSKAIKSVGLENAKDQNCHKGRQNEVTEGNNDLVSLLRFWDP